VDPLAVAILATPAFVASAVEFVEATTIVLAVGVTRGWRAPLLGTIAATGTLAIIIATLGVALVTIVPELLLKGVVGALLLLFGLRWLRKAVLRFAGIVAIHDEELIYRREVAELEARLNALKDRLPGEKEIPTLYRTVSDAATASGLGVALFQPRPPVVRDYYSEIPIALNAEAGYHQFGEFFERIAKMARVVNITEIKLNGLNRPRVPVRAELVLATYMYRPIGAPPAPRPAGAR